MSALQSRCDTFVNRFTMIGEPQERLAALVSRGQRFPAMPLDNRTDEIRVPGCVSKVWILPRFDSGVCTFLMDAESPLVRGLVGVLCECAEGALPEELAASPIDVLERLGVLRGLSPTRQNGLHNVAITLQAFGRSQCS